MSKSKLIVFTLCLVLIAGMAWGGGGSQPAAAAAGGPMVITWTANGQLAPLDENPYMIKKWNEMFNVDIQLWHIDPANYFDVLNLRFAANEIPDFFQSDANRLQLQFEQRLLAEIPENLVREHLPISHKEFSELFPNYLKLTSFNNKIYGLRVFMDKPYRAPIVYRGDWIRNVGKQGTPKTLAEFEELVYLFTNNDPDRNGRKDTYGLSVTAFQTVYGAYGQVRSQWNIKNNELVYTSIQPEMKDALTVLAKWYRDGVIDPEFITGENKGGYWAVSHAFTEGRIGISSHGSFYHWDAPDNNRANIVEMQARDPVAAASTVLGEPVTGPQGKKGVSMGHPVFGNLWAFGVQNDTNHAKIAKVMDIQNYFVSDPEVYITAFYGIRGQDWEYNPAMNNAPMQIGGKGNDYVYRIGAGATIKPLVTPSGEAARNAAWAQFCPANNLYSDGYRNELIVPPPSSGRYLTELNKIEDEAYIAIITGAQPVSYFDRFVSEWRAAGGDVLTREANAWFNTIK